MAKFEIHDNVLGYWQCMCCGGDHRREEFVPIKYGPRTKDSYVMERLTREIWAPIIQEQLGG